MLTQEYIQLVKDLQLDKLLEFAKRFFVSKYNGDVCSITNSDWPNTYILTVQRGEKTINRFFHISVTIQHTRHSGRSASFVVGANRYILLS